MKTVVLVVTACLAGDPTHCEDHRLPVYEPISFEGCIMSSFAQVATFIEQRPDLRVKRWTCAMEDRDAASD